ncbi:hypothetical protein ACOCJ5_07445 [Knoellia sp. CPCC 206450]|uniref:hypothetical protein n=1 Tax=Knoellia tibetensis TaxID=3404798 RepID=UPI003B43BCF3
MSSTTAGDLLTRAHHLTRILRDSNDPITADQWRTFDATVHRLLQQVLGPDGRNVPLGDRRRLFLVSVLRGYPAHPGQPTPESRHDRPDHLGPDQDAPVEPLRTTASRHLRVVRGAPHGFAATQRLDAPCDSAVPADPTDPHPLARLSCTLGVLSDLVDQTLQPTGRWLERLDELGYVTRHITCIALIAARHTLARGQLADLDRPLRIAQFAEQVVELLQVMEPVPPPPLYRARVTFRYASPTSSQERLRIACDEWTKTALREVGRSLPNAEALRTIAYQGAHLSAVTLEVGKCVGLPEDHVEALGNVTAHLRAAGKPWDHLTTLNRPTQQMIPASRALFAELEATRARLTDLGPVESRKALESLTVALDDVTHVMSRARSLPERLVRSRLVFAPARRLRATPERLADIAKGRYVPVTLEDVPDLGGTWLRAASSLEWAQRTRQRSAVHTLGPLRVGISPSLG